KINGGIGNAVHLGSSYIIARGLRNVAAPAEPKPAILEGVGQADCEPAGARTAFGRAWYAVGNNYDARHKPSSQVRLRRMADSTIPTIEKVCGKLPQRTPSWASTSSDSKPR